MMNECGTFERYEKKYLLNSIQYECLKKKLEGKIAPDQFPEGRICNIYYDTPDRRLIRRSLERPVYKEKLRLRSYGVPKEDSTVFMELKKKYRGVVYKRRVDAKLGYAEAFLSYGSKEAQKSQVYREIQWFLSFYRDLEPAMFISYHRTAWKGEGDSGLRLTFDNQILWREDALDLRSGVWGNELLRAGQYLMELKIAEAIPLWMSAILDELHIVPVSMSKYGEAYRIAEIRHKETEGILNYA